MSSLRTNISSQLTLAINLYKKKKNYFAYQGKHSCVFKYIDAYLHRFVWRVCIGCRFVITLNVMRIYYPLILHFKFRS